MTIFGPSAASTRSARLFGGFASLRLVIDEGEPAPVEGNEGSSVHAIGRSSPDVSTPCGANRPVASASAIRLVSRPSTTSALVEAPSSLRRASSVPASSLSTHSSVQPQLASKRSLMVPPGPYSPAKAAIGVDGQHRLFLRRGRRRHRARGKAQGGGTRVNRHRLLLPDHASNRKAPKRREMEADARQNLNPSAGMIRIRFDGSAEFSASQPLGHPERRAEARAHRVRMQERFRGAALRKRSAKPGSVSV